MDEPYVLIWFKRPGLLPVYSGYHVWLRRGQPLQRVGFEVGQTGTEKDPTFVDKLCRTHEQQFYNRLQVPTCRLFVVGC